MARTSMETAWDTRKKMLDDNMEEVTFIRDAESSGDKLFFSFLLGGLFDI